MFGSLESIIRSGCSFSFGFAVVKCATPTFISASALIFCNSPASFPILFRRACVSILYLIRTKRHSPASNAKLNSFVNFTPVADVVQINPARFQIRSQNPNYKPSNRFNTDSIANILSAGKAAMRRSIFALSTPAMPSTLTTDSCRSHAGFGKGISHSPPRISVVIGTTTDILR
jgi:hypothetical protein